MDGRIDLTDNRDFRRKSKSPYPNRSIFNKHQNPDFTSFASVSNITFSVTGSMFFSSMTNDINSTINIGNIYPVNEKQSETKRNNCDRCGTELRLPWYGHLCKKCHNHLKEDLTKRIPWK